MWCKNGQFKTLFDVELKQQQAVSYVPAVGECRSARASGDQEVEVSGVLEGQGREAASQSGYARVASV